MTEGNELFKRHSGMHSLGNTPELQAEFDQAVAEIKRKQNEHWVSLWLLAVVLLLVL